MAEKCLLLLWKATAVDCEVGLCSSAQQEASAHRARLLGMGSSEPRWGSATSTSASPIQPCWTWGSCPTSRHFERSYLNPSGSSSRLHWLRASCAPEIKTQPHFPPCAFSILARNVMRLVMNSLLGNQYEPRRVTAPRLMEVTWHRKLPVICTASPQRLSVHVSLTMGTDPTHTGAHQQESPRRVWTRRDLQDWRGFFFPNTHGQNTKAAERKDPMLPVQVGSARVAAVCRWWWIIILGKANWLFYESSQPVPLLALVSHLIQLRITSLLTLSWEMPTEHPSHSALHSQTEHLPSFLPPFLPFNAYVWFFIFSLVIKQLLFFLISTFYNIKKKSRKEIQRNLRL